MHRSLKPKKILVVGDLMLDIYTMGDVHRISPEAPVPVLCVKEEIHRPGGAGNAILNLISLGMEVTAIGRVGNDWGGHTFLEEMTKERVDIRGIIKDDSFHTPLKNRMIANGQQIARIDYEKHRLLNDTLESEIIEQLPTLFEGVDTVAISDYGKGFLTQPVLASVIAYGKSKQIPVIVDPKGMDFSRYRGATLIKPNLAEAISAAGLGVEATLDEVAARILNDVAIETLLVTRSKEGISVFSQNQERADFPARIHEVKDVTGAGDTVLAVITAALANCLPVADAAILANVAAGIAIERLGCARISLADLASRLLP
jgi:rfaE bifunctional protein kinase chain/domain